MEKVAKVQAKKGLLVRTPWSSQRALGAGLPGEPPEMDFREPGKNLMDSKGKPNVLRNWAQCQAHRVHNVLGISFHLREGKAMLETR